MSDYLIHYGVPGMKWGVRKARPTSGVSRRQAKKQIRQLNKMDKRRAILANDNGRRLDRIAGNNMVIESAVANRDRYTKDDPRWAQYEAKRKKYADANKIVGDAYNRDARKIRSINTHADKVVKELSSQNIRVITKDTTRNGVRFTENLFSGAFGGPIRYNYIPSTKYRLG